MWGGSRRHRRALGGPRCVTAAHKPPEGGCEGGIAAEAHKQVDGVQRSGGRSAGSPLTEPLPLPVRFTLLLLQGYGKPKPDTHTHTHSDLLPWCVHDLTPASEAFERRALLSCKRASLCTNELFWKFLLTSEIIQKVAQTVWRSSTSH